MFSWSVGYAIFFVISGMDCVWSWIPVALAVRLAWCQLWSNWALVTWQSSVFSFVPVSFSGVYFPIDSQLHSFIPPTNFHKKDFSKLFVFGPTTHTLHLQLATWWFVRNSATGNPLSPRFSLGTDRFNGCRFPDGTHVWQRSSWCLLQMQGGPEIEKWDSMGIVLMERLPFARSKGSLSHVTCIYNIYIYHYLQDF